MEKKGEVDEIDIGTFVKSSYIRNPRSSNKKRRTLWGTALDLS